MTDTSQLTGRQRSSLARNAAINDLIVRHSDEFQALYRWHAQQLGIQPRKSHTVPIAPDEVGQAPAAK